MLCDKTNEKPKEFQPRAARLPNPRLLREQARVRGEGTITLSMTSEPVSPSKLGRWAAALWGLLAALWLLHVLARVNLVGGARLVFAAAVVATVVWGVGKGRGQWLLVGLVVLSLAVRFTGVDHELSGRYAYDEGTYHKHARDIDGGNLLSRSFVYPHLTYDVYAFALWLADLARPLVASVAAWGSNAHDPIEVDWLVLRWVGALLGALAVIPVALLARRLGGAPAALFAGLGLIVAPHLNFGSHVFVSDVPSAFCAAVSLAFAGRLFDRERTRDYLLAGAWSGLAAASKYPAGVVAVAIAALWLRHRIAERNIKPGLLWAALASIAAFVLPMPSLFVYPEIAFFGGRGMFFGVKQYGQGGWLGVQPDSNALYYLGLLGENFGWIALGGAALGLGMLARRERTQVLWMTPFPLVFFALLSAMSMVVKRNLFPALPMFAVLVGVGLASLCARVPARWTQRSGRASGPLVNALTAGLAGVAVVSFAFPAQRTVIETVGLARPTTRELAADWVRVHVPPGARIFKEQYTPDFPRDPFDIVRARFAGRLSTEEIERGEVDFVLMASDAYRRFENPELQTREHHRRVAQNYRAIFRYPEVASWVPGRFRNGPIVRLLRVPARACGASADLPSVRATVPDAGMRAEGAQGAVRFTLPGQWSLWRACLESGRYLARFGGPNGLNDPKNPIGEGGTLRVVDEHNRTIAETSLSPSLEATFEISERAELFLYVHLPPGNELRRLVVTATRPIDR